MKRVPSGKVGAVVIGGDYQGLGIVQSLGRLHVPVCILDDEPSIAKYSRYATHSVKLRNLRDQRATVDAVLAVGRRLGLKGWVLYPTRDETVAALSRNRGLLAEYFRVPTPEWATIRWTWDKRNTYRLAEQLEIPVPRTWYPANVDELRRMDVDFPVAIKPAIKERFIYATKAKAWRANDRTEMEGLFLRAAKLLGQGEVMVQELVPGDGRQQFAYCAFFKQGRAVGSMVVRRTRQHPAEFGRASTFVETTDLPILETLSNRFLCAIDYYGLVEMEYKLDPRDGQYKLLDANARTWGYHTLGCRAGVDFPSLLFADQLGQPVEQQRGLPGISWIRLLTDLPTGICGILGGHLDWKAYLRSLRDAHVEAVFSREDPMPGITELALAPYLSVRRGF
ncbi:MAG: ATP-grasp domain-containing protein [Terriglobia bacterium]